MRRSAVPEPGLRHRPEEHGPVAAGGLSCAPGIWKEASLYMAARQLGHGYRIAEQQYAGVIDDIPADAKTVEAAIGVAELVGEVVRSVAAGRPPGVSHAQADQRLDDIFSFGVRRRPHGRKTLLRQEDAEAFDADPDLTQAALAARMGLSRPRVTQLLHLLKIPEEALEIILDLPPTANGCPISERALRPLLALDDPAARAGAIREQLGDFIPLHLDTRDGASDRLP